MKSLIDIKSLFIKKNKSGTLRWGITTLLLFVSLIFVQRVFSPHSDVSLNKPQSEQVITFSIEPAGPDPASYSTSLDFGKGKYSVFWIHPPNEDLIVDTIRIRKQGVSDEDMPYAWLRLNGIRSYVRTPFRDNLAIFHIFPEPNPSEGTYETYTSKQETQKLTLIGAPNNFTVSTKKDVSVQIYGQFGLDIAPREQINGIRFCVEEVSGTIASTGQKASTQLASPLCFNKMGIKE